MDGLTPLIKDSFAVISLILVFVFVLFDVRYPQITRLLQKDIPPAERKIERNATRKEIKEGLIRFSLPLAVIDGILLYLLLPLLVQVIQNSRLAVWNFDFARTAFVIIFGLIIFFFSWSIYLSYLLIKKIRAAR